MSLRFLNRIRKTTGFRLTLWYSAIFILSSLALFGIAYVLLSSSLKQKDQETIQAKLKDYQAQYRTGGIIAIKNELNFEKYAGKPNIFFIRVAGPKNQTLFLSIPDQWGNFDLKSLENGDSSVKESWTYLRAVDRKKGVEIASAPLPDGCSLQIGKNTESREELLESFRKAFIAVMIPVILLGVFGGQFLAFRALRPIRQLIHTVRAITATGKIDSRVPTRQTGDELDELVLLFNQMLGQIEVLINGMKDTLDNVAHDLRTPMTRLRGMAEMALQGKQTSENCREALADCLEESERVLKMLNTLMDISEAETGALKLKLEPVNISELLENVVELYRYVAEDKQLVVHTAYPRELYVTADRHRLLQALANLLDNALKYSPSGGRVEVEADAYPQEVVINIKDSGPGIPPEEIPKIWERLYRGDQSRSQRGLGLGLSLVKAIVAAHRGHVEVASQPGVGSCFSVHLPKQP